MNGNASHNSIGTNPIICSYVSLADIYNHLLDNIILILIAAILGAAFTNMLSDPITSTYYSSTSKIFVANGEQNTTSLQNLNIAEDLIGDYIAAFSNLEFHEMVIQKLNLPYTPQELSNMVSVYNMNNTHILCVTVTVQTTAEDAQLLATTYAEMAGDFYKSKYNINETSVFEKASQPITSHIVSGTTSPTLGIFVGIILSCSLIMIFAMYDDRIYTPEDITRVLEIEVLGIMPK